MNDCSPLRPMLTTIEESRFPSWRKDIVVLIQWEAISGVTGEGMGVGVNIGVVVGTELGVGAGDSGAGDDADGPQAASKSRPVKRRVAAMGFNWL